MWGEITYQACDYLSMLGLKLNHVSKRGYRCNDQWIKKERNIYISIQNWLVILSANIDNCFSKIVGTDKTTRDCWKYIDFILTSGRSKPPAIRLFIQQIVPVQMKVKKKKNSTPLMALCVINPPNLSPLVTPQVVMRTCGHLNWY